MIANVKDLGRVEMAEGLRAPCCNAWLAPQQVRHKDGEIEIVCPGCGRTVLRVELPAFEDHSMGYGYD